MDKQLHLQTCEKVIGIFFRIKFDQGPKISIDCVWYIKRSIDDVQNYQISKHGSQEGPMMKNWK